MRRSEAPSAFAALTKSCLLMESAMPRMMRAKPAHSMKLMITTMSRYTAVDESLTGKALRRASMRKNPGTSMKHSANRMSTLSILPP